MLGQDEQRREMAQAVTHLLLPADMTLCSFLISICGFRAIPGQKEEAEIILWTKGIGSEVMARTKAASPISPLSHLTYALF